MTNPTSLADLIVSKFTPLAFTCDCKGQHPDCRRAMEDTANWTQNETVKRIAKFLKSLEE